MYIYFFFLPSHTRNIIISGQEVEQQPSWHINGFRSISHTFRRSGVAVYTFLNGQIHTYIFTPLTGVTRPHTHFLNRSFLNLTVCAAGGWHAHILTLLLCWVLTLRCTANEWNNQRRMDKEKPEEWFVTNRFSKSFLIPVYFFFLSDHPPGWCSFNNHPHMMAVFEMSAACIVLHVFISVKSCPSRFSFDYNTPLLLSVAIIAVSRISGGYQF